MTLMVLYNSSWKEDDLKKRKEERGKRRERSENVWARSARQFSVH